MKEENINKLDKLLSNHKTRKERREEEVKQEAIRKDVFLDEFESFADSSIKPIIIEIGDRLKADGHDYSVSYKGKHIDSTKITDKSSIKMEVYPDGNGRGDAYNKPAHISFYADEAKKTIGVHENNVVPSSARGGTAGSRNYDYSLEKLTDSEIENEIIKFVGNILDKT